MVRDAYGRYLDLEADTEFRAKSIQQSDLAWGAILEKMLAWLYFPNYNVNFPKMISSLNVLGTL